MNLGASNKIEFVRNGLAHMEDGGKSNLKLRPIKSVGKGGGKIWTINIEEKYDIDFTENSKDAMLQ